MHNIAYASSHHTSVAQGFVAKINDVILFPLITLLLALALLLFLWGAFRFIAGAGDEEARTTGKRHMLFGVIGMLIMVSAFAILQIAAGTFGIGVPR